MRQICQTLGFNKSTFYYQPKSDASEEVLRAEIQRLAAAYPTYGYRRITKLLVAEGHTVGYKRVARLRYSDFSRSQRVSLGERVRRKVDPNAQGRRSSPQ